MAPDWKPSPGGGAVALEVENFEVAVSRLKASGTAFLNGPFETPVCHMAVVADPDGNSITIHKRKTLSPQ
jgi:predicted enzyme related to lactoylglutathione lyase